MRIKKEVIVAFIVIIILVVMIEGSFYFYKKNLIPVVKTNKNQYEVNSSLKISDIISEIKKGKLSSKDKEVDTSKIGKHTIEIELINNSKVKHSYMIEFQVVDTIPPVIKAKSELETTTGTKIDLLKNVEVTDNSLEKCSVEIVGTYDFNKEGTYNLEYKASDSSKNTTTEKVVLKILPVKKTESYSSTTSKGYSITVKNGITYVDGYLVANKTYALPSTYAPGLTNETTTAFNNLKSAATKENLSINIISGFRTYQRQKTIYNNYVANDGVASADTYSARPGHSEHQTGLAFDVNSLSTSFGNTNEGKWISSNCYKYGFILRYPKGKDNETGYMYEPWHLRYVGVDLATKLYNNGDWISLESYFGITSKYK